MSADVAAARSLLFVPGDRADRFDKALASGADVVVVDLEDAVAPDAKAAAREAVDAALSDGARFAVRVNAAGTPWHAADVALVQRHGVPVVLPKADAGSVGSLPEGLTVVALVESAQGLLDAPVVATSPAVVRLALGHLDLAAELGVSPDARPVVDHARVTLLTASVAAGLPGPVDGVTPQVRDADRLAADLAAATELGCAGKLCIHPAQVAAVHAALAPTADELAWARKVLAAEAEGGAGVLLVDGQMVDAPVLVRARRVVALAPPTEGEPA